MGELRPEQLPSRLQSGIAPVYLLTGDEPLLIEEALNAIRVAARAQGFDEREVLHADAGFEWGRLRETASTLSLFSARRLLELRMPEAKPGREGARVLQDYAVAPPEDMVLVVVAGPLDARQRKAAWIRALAGAGGHMHAWPVSPGQLPGWLGKRLRGHGLNADQDAVALLAERAEGNLLAAAQEVEKLALLCQGGHVTEADVRDAVGDSARFVPFDLTPAIAAGDVARVWRIITALREEDAEPVLVLGVLARMLRVLVEVQGSRAGGGADAVFRRYRIRRSEQALLRRAAAGPHAGAWQALLPEAARVDRAIKGAAPGRAWDELLHLAISMARQAAGVGTHA